MRGFLVLLGLTSYTQLPRVPGPSFTLSGPLPSTLTIPQGGNQATWITLTPEESFAGSVHLTLAHWDGSSAPGFALTPSSVWLSGNAVHETLGDSALDTLAPRSYALKLRAQSGHLAQEKDLGVLVLLALKPRLPGRGENGYFVATHLGQTLRPHQGAGFRLDVPLGFTLTLSPGALTQGCLTDLHQVSRNPNLWNALVACEATQAFQGPGQVGVVALTGSGGGVLSLEEGILVQAGSYEEESVAGGSLSLGP
ncbi:hypothetical protein [Thermus thalpophilus]|uniref:hypothetical protein n=1 Tax=Thermus thalpophilus TaxID=2908147 RepID=UPI001FAA2BB6|nr:hypothetical protein [Thermus thalpophilus]